MKIQLKRNFNPHSPRLRCVVCESQFASGKLRTLLCHQDESIAGDICMDCLGQGANYIQQQLKARAIVLLQQPWRDDISPSPHKQALELWELANSHLILPSIYQRLWQRLLIFAAATKDLGLAKRGSSNRRAQQSKLPTVTFLEEEPYSGKDN
ncbi:hypothetical protein [Chamaesiphon minutus]|uniref:Uncharacterized protein n=1 Tax=Chamaesiphon minutus (strain ATCC 27169 / PCC 6605) TaxID=1173020 RepID=K9UK29_CHAP6|nr:hypothetical protein [Chamaesiphon minutus]AFY94559.1 hypothetical protein Cha6605_3570 [Chamaesiphon minutus PCC 6605]